MVTTTKLERRHQSWRDVCQSYYQLTKPRIIPLLLITTAAALWVASEGQVDLKILFFTLTGGALAAASAQVFNCIYDQDIDYEMLRTRERPLPSGRVQPRHALIFGLALGALSFGLFALFVNLLSGLLALSGIVFYLLIYTHALKRHTVQNIVIGGAAGAIPPLVGWAAVTGDLSWSAWLLFALVFAWTPPHFWALALMIKDDYAQVSVPMLPVVAGDEATVKQIWLYSLAVVPLSLLLVYPLHACGYLYGLAALVLGGKFLAQAWCLRQAPHDRELARELFKFSIFYLMLLSLAMVIDSLSLLHFPCYA
ncbi:MAG: heme o synthase [Cyanobacteriota bacterium]|jgi:protoheme IX farnesyltransferase